MKEKARLFATKAHTGQIRKSTEEAYITHPIRVAEKLEALGFTEELVTAGYLHDVVEDTPVEMEEIEQEFGEEVARLVATHTEDKSKSWTERKQHTIDTVKTAHKEVKYLIVADKLDNLLSFEKALQEHGDTVWDHFNAGRSQQKWYNESIAKNMYIGLDDKDVPAYFEEFKNAVTRVFD